MDTESINNPIYRFRENNGGCFYVAREGWEIGLTIWFCDEPEEAISELHPVCAQDYSSRSWPEFYRHCLVLNFGRLISDREFSNLKAGLSDYVTIACEGYTDNGTECRASFSEAAEDAIRMLVFIIEEETRDFMEPSDLSDIFADLSAEDWGVRTSTTDEDLLNIALDQSAQTIPLMHPRDALHILESMREDERETAMYSMNES